MQQSAADAAALPGSNAWAARPASSLLTAAASDLLPLQAKQQDAAVAARGAWWWSTMERQLLSAGWLMTGTVASAGSSRHRAQHGTTAAPRPAGLVRLLLTPVQQWLP